MIYVLSNKCLWRLTFGVECRFSLVKLYIAYCCYGGSLGQFQLSTEALESAGLFI
jgi:hypothetical protein